MVSGVSPTNSNLLTTYSNQNRKTADSTENAKTIAKEDKIQFGKQSLSTKESQQIVYERAMEKLRSIVDEARTELGVPEGVILDTSPDATADRILGFALNFFSKYAENNGLNDDEEGRKQFADFIGGAINQGIGEARDILGSLNALTGDTTTNIDKTAENIQKGLEDFVKNGLNRTAQSA